MRCKSSKGLRCKHFNVITEECRTGNMRCHFQYITDKPYGRRRIEGEFVKDLQGNIVN